MKNIFCCILLLSLFSCSEKDNFNNEKAKDSIWSYYLMASPMNGGGGYRIEKLEIISTEKKNDTLYFVVAKVQGAFEKYEWKEKLKLIPVDERNLYIIKKQKKVWLVTSVL